MLSRIVLAVIAAAAGFAAADAPVRAQATPAEPGRVVRPASLVGARCDTMVKLVRYLDQTAQGALEGAADDVRDGSPLDARFLSTIRSFAKSAEDLQRTLGDCRVTSAELPSQVADLARRAREFGERIRAAQALSSIYQEWGAVADVLERMARLLAGEEVDVPADYVVPALAGPSLRELRRLAADLQLAADRAHDRATRTVGDYPDRGQQFLGELHHFAVQSRDLKRRADARKVAPQEVGPLVDLLLEEARQADRRMRDAQVFKEAWDDSAQAITILQRMVSLVRS